MDRERQSITSVMEAGAMDTGTLKTFIAMAMAAVLTACAMDPVTVSPREPHAVVVIAQQKLASDIHPVVITEIDGRRQQGRKLAYWLSPGKHTLRLRAQITDFTGHREDLYDDRDPKGILELDLEEGQRYVIGARQVGDKRDQWEPAVISSREISGYSVAER